MHQPSYTIIRTALAIASSGVGSDKQAFTPTSLTGLVIHWLLSVTFLSRAPVRVFKTKSLLRNIDLWNTSNILPTGNIIICVRIALSMERRVQFSQQHFGWTVLYVSTAFD